MPSEFELAIFQQEVVMHMQMWLKVHVQNNSKAGLFWQKKLRLFIPDQRPQTDLGHWALAAPRTPVANLLAASAACSSILHDLSLQRIQQNCFDKTYPGGGV